MSYARITTLNYGNAETMEAAIRRLPEYVSLLREQPGFCGALNLTDRERSAALLVLLWETVDEATRPLTSRVARLKPAAGTLTR